MDITHRLDGVSFGWDARKARGNAAKHGVTFEEAAEAFLDPFQEGGDASVASEHRDFVIGYSRARRLLVVVYVEHPDAIRIISARTATRAERSQYEQR